MTSDLKPCPFCASNIITGWSDNDRGTCNQCGAECDEWNRRDLYEPAHTAAQEKNERLREALLDSAASLAAAISLLEKGGRKAAWSDRVFEQMLKDYNRALEKARAALGKEGT